MRFHEYAITALFTLGLGVTGCEFLDTKKRDDKQFVCGDVVLLNRDKYTSCNYLCSTQYKSLAIEIDAVKGMQPINDDDLSLLEKILGRIIDKPNGITHTRSDVSIDSDKEVYSIGDIEQLVKKYRSFDKKTLALYVLYLNGGFKEPNVAGIALDNGVIVIFRERVPQSHDKSILMHEIGHHLGLVNNGIPQKRMHEDKEHSGHDSNNVCVMFYRLTNPLNYLFDKQCLEDIRHARGD